ncbi:dihydrodipicolinate synthase family protein [Larkinella bovis]|uniref:Dihydrodipicolinate synthase family protein n=1 Tax=Larkinella bovis TaxID=683041 RepID=A0ABW0IAI5_9BACT
MNWKKISGLIAAPFTPMRTDGSLHLSMVPEYYRRLKQNGIAGAFIIGSTGEGVSLSLDEKKQVIAAWADCTHEDPDFTLIPLLGGTCLTDCIELALFAREAGADAVSFTAPFYFKPASVQQLAECCQHVAGAVPDLPFYYYHIPVLNGVGFPVYDLLQAVDGLIPNFAGIKYTHEDFMDFLSCIHYQNGKYDMLWGRDENMLPALALGTRGAVGSTYNYVPALYHELMAAFDAGDLPKAARLQQVSIDLIRLLGKYGGISVGKAYMKVVGLDCGEFRLPVKNMDAIQWEQFKEDVRKLRIERYFLT